MSIFTGSGVAIITPFDDHGVNTKELARMIEFQIENKTDAIIICGTTGEPSTMSVKERRAAITCAIQTVRGRIPVIAGTGSNNTATTIEDSMFAQNAGADGLLIVTPYYNKCTQGGLIAHYHAIAEEVNIPIVVYNVPGRTGVNILPATLKKIAQHKNIVAVKEASANIEQLMEIAAQVSELDLYSGNDDHILPILSLGGKGVISVLANIAPKMTHDIVQSFLDGDIAKSRELQFKVNPLVKTLFTEVNPIPVKTAAGLMGYQVGNLRLPLTPMSEGPKEDMAAQMRALGLIR